MDPFLKPRDIKRKINDAFGRIELDEPNYIWIDVLENAVILKGYVKSWGDRDDAEDAARSITGSTRVINNLEIDNVS